MYIWRALNLISKIIKLCFWLVVFPLTILVILIWAVCTEWTDVDDRRYFVRLVKDMLW